MTRQEFELAISEFEQFKAEDAIEKSGPALQAPTTNCVHFSFQVISIIQR
jgi:hypothetical protein